MADSPLETTIETVAALPKRVSGDEGSVEQQPLKDLIEADRHLANQNSGANPHRALRFFRMVNPGGAS